MDSTTQTQIFYCFIGITELGHQNKILISFFFVFSLDWMSCKRNILMFHRTTEEKKKGDSQYRT